MRNGKGDTVHGVHDARVLAHLAQLAECGARVVVTVTVLPHEEPRGEERLTLAEAAKVARTSRYVVAEAVRAGELPASGRQRDRSVTRADLHAWIAKRVVKVEPPDDGDIAERVERMARGRRAKASAR